MSTRESVYVSRRVPTDGGVSPNLYFAQVTTEIREFFPPHTPTAKLIKELTLAYTKAMNELLERHGRVPKPLPNRWVVSPEQWQPSDEL